MGLTDQSLFPPVKTSCGATGQIFHDIVSYPITWIWWNPTLYVGTVDAGACIWASALATWVHILGRHLGRSLSPHIWAHWQFPWNRVGVPVPCSSQKWCLSTINQPANLCIKLKVFFSISWCVSINNVNLNYLIINIIQLFNYFQIHRFYQHLIINIITHKRS